MVISQHIELDETKAPAEKVESAIRDAVRVMMERKPLAMVLIFEDASGGVVCSAIGPPRDLIPLYNVGGDQLQRMMRKALDSANQNG